MYEVHSCHVTGVDIFTKIKGFPNIFYFKIFYIGQTGKIFKRKKLTQQLKNIYKLLQPSKALQGFLKKYFF